MNHTEVVELIANKTGMSKYDVNLVMFHFFETVKDTTVNKGEEVKVRRFGKFVRRISKPKQAFGKMTNERTSVRFVSARGNN